MNVVDSLVVTLGLDASGFEKGAKDADDALKKTKERVVKHGKDIEASNKIVEASFGSITKTALEFLAVLGSTSALKNLIENTTNAEAAVGRLSARLNTSSSDFSAFQNAFRLAGGSADQAAGAMQGMMDKLNQLRLNGNALPDWVYRAVGGLRNIDTSKGPLAAIDELMRKMESVKDTGKRAFIFGQIDPNLVPLANLTYEQWKRNYEFAQKNSMSAEETKRAVELQTQLTRVQEIWEHIERVIAGPAQAALIGFMKGVEDLLTKLGDDKGLASKWQALAKDFGDLLAEFGATPPSGKTIIGVIDDEVNKAIADLDKLVKDIASFDEMSKEWTLTRLLNVGSGADTKDSFIDIVTGKPRPKGDGKSPFGELTPYSTPPSVKAFDALGKAATDTNGVTNIGGIGAGFLSVPTLGPDAMKRVYDEEMAKRGGVQKASLEGAAIRANGSEISSGNPMPVFIARTDTSFWAGLWDSIGVGSLLNAGGSAGGSGGGSSGGGSPGGGSTGGGNAGTGSMSSGGAGPADTRNIWERYAPRMLGGKDASTGAGVARTPGQDGVLPQQTGSLPRNLRNNNPGNVIDGAWARSQPGYKGSDGHFAQFDTMENGYRASNSNLDSYARKGFVTPMQILGRWAPAGSGEGNDPVAYANRVAKLTGLDPNKPVGSDPESRAKMLAGITAVEGGRASPYTSAQISAALGGAPLPTGAADAGIPVKRAPQTAAAGEAAPALPVGADSLFPSWMDESSKRQLGQVNADLARNLIEASNKTGIQFSVRQGLRTQAEAAANALKGTGVRDSQHLYGAAVDLNVAGGRYAELGRAYEAAAAAKGQPGRWLGSVGGRWGNDVVHYDQGIGYGQNHPRTPYAATGGGSQNAVAPVVSQWQKLAEDVRKAVAPAFEGIAKYAKEHAASIPKLSRVPNVATGASGAARTSPGVTNHLRTAYNNTSNEAHVHNLHVHTQANDADNIARDIGPALKQNFFADTANYGLA